MLILQISGYALLLIFLAIGAYIGWARGIRAFLTIALGTLLAYLICVRYGDQFIAIINRFYTNGPKFAAFAAGRDPSTVASLDPIISSDFRVPLFFRVVLFVILFLVAWFLNKRPKWYIPNPDLKQEPLSRFLGAFGGAFTVLLLISAVTTFAQEYVASGGILSGFIGTILSILPDVGVFIPSMIAIFVLVMLVVFIIRLPRVWRHDSRLS